MDKLLIGLKSQLEEQSATLRELKHENAVLRKVVGQIQMDVNKIKEIVPFDNPNTANKFLSSSSEREKPISSITKEPPGKYVPKKIRSMTLDDEREWLKAHIEELKLQHKSKIERSVVTFEESISKIFSNLRLRKPPTCAIKLANYSMSTLFNPLYYVGQNNGRKIRLPLLINSGSGEAICFQGNGGFCRFLCSFSIGTTLLRLTMFCWINSNGHGQLAIGFSPRDLPLDDSIISLDSVLTQNSNLPHDWVVSSLNKSPVEMFLNQGYFYVRGHMTPDHNSVVNIDIFESNVPTERTSIFSPIRTTCSNFAITLDNFRRVSCLVGFSDVITCAMEVVNGLNVSLKLLGCRSFECARMLAEVPPLGSEMFIAAGKTGIEAAFAYEIKGTDLGFLVAIKTQGKENQFAAAFLNVANFMCDDTLDELLDQTKWNILLRQKFAYAKDGEQTYQIRNIRANIKMTDRQKSEVTPSSQWNFHSVFACMGI